MPKVLSDQQVANAASVQWKQGDTLVTMIAISFAENRDSDPRAVHRNADGTIDVGLWQINVERHPPLTEEQLFDTGNNAQAAHDIQASEGFTAWTTFKNSTYLVYLPRARAVAASATGSEQSSPTPIPSRTEAPGPFDEIGRAATAAVHAGEWFTNKHNWLRIIYVIGGVALVIVGLGIVADASKALPSPVKALK